ncbi:hypothetical protein HII13_002480 [Brettanomyces bruxellensis]|nr:hypothetical protein HII13_002480 [Brettanomyces bruxellensis]
MVTVTALRIAEASDGYVLQPTTESGTRVLHINKSGEIKVSDLEKIPLTSKFTTIAGVIGVIHLHSNRYLLTADGASEAGTICGNKKVYQVATFSVRPLSIAAFNSADDLEKKYLMMLKSHLDAATLYFSYDYDLTRRFGEQVSLDQGKTEFASEFMWNNFVSEPLIDAAKGDRYVAQFILPLIYGYAKFVRTTICGTPITFGLITRRSRHRAGTRYFRRGIDNDGYVANFNETEQFLVLNTEKGEHVNTYFQIRGSVPVFWSEMNNLKYKPPLYLGPSDYIPARKHFDRSISRYGSNYLVNLVNSSGHEEPVKQAYESAVTALADPKLRYVYFDFHHECRMMRWDRVKLLLTKLVELGLSREDFSSFSVTSDNITNVKVQEHVVRTNCMDCLDRTNVVQSMLARWFLQEQLQESHVISGTQDWSALDPAFNLVFQNVWADNADAVSNSYSGTGALKTDYTRTGKRTTLGALNDLMNSISRYIINNFMDGPRQDGYDLFLGNSLPYDLGPEALEDQRPKFVQWTPYGLFIAIWVFISTFLSPKGSLTEFKNYSFLTTLFLVAAFSFRYMLVNGVQFVNWPKLCPPEFLVKSEILKNGKLAGIRYVRSSAYSKHLDDEKRV